MTDKKKQKQPKTKVTKKAKGARGSWKERAIKALEKASALIVRVHSGLPGSATLNSLPELLKFVEMLPADYEPSRKPKGVQIGSYIMLKPERAEHYSKLGLPRFEGAIVTNEDGRNWIVQLKDGVKTIVPKRDVSLYRAAVTQDPEDGDYEPGEENLDANDASQGAA